ncbi:MAG TPA: hypothetical protein VFU46_04510, partial [Gemmatimonadales bacterium]|nr:hypothetical protein [Gemmatimonadales bacterium]
TLTPAYRAFRRALALDPGYALPYFHVNDLLRAASAARPPLLLLPGDSIADNGRAPAGRDALAAAIARARREWLAQARAWVVAQPGTRHAHFALLDAHARLGDHSAALTEIERFRGSSGGNYPELPFDRATARFAAGEIDQGAEELARALDTLTAGQFARAEAAEEVVRAIAASANIYAYQGDLERARRVIALAGDVSRQFDSAMGVRLELPRELESWRMLGELYAAFGAPAPSLRRVWEAAAEAGRSAPAARRPAILASGGAAAVGLLAAAGGDTLAVAELRRLDGRPLAPEVDALLALSRRDSLAARQVIAGVAARPQRVAAGEGYYTVFYRPLAAQVLYALGDYAGALRALEGVDPTELEPRQFDMRWGILPRVHLLRALAHERRGDRDAAAREYHAVLTQWKRADPALHPVLAQAGRGLLRLGETTEQLTALGYQLTASMEGEGGCSVGPSPGERR